MPAGLLDQQRALVLGHQFVHVLVVLDWSLLLRFGQHMNKLVTQNKCTCQVSVGNGQPLTFATMLTSQPSSPSMASRSSMVGAPAETN